MRVIRSVQGLASYISSMFIFVICVLISSKKGGRVTSHAFHPSGFTLDCIISNCRVRLVLQIYSSRYLLLIKDKNSATQPILQ